MERRHALAHVVGDLDRLILQDPWRRSAEAGRRGGRSR